MKYFSQQDEDGVTLRVIDRMGLKPGTFLEIGVGNGLENNTLILLLLGWRGAWIGNEEIAFKLCSGRKLRFLKQWVTKDNCVELATRAVGNLVNVDVLSVDVDGNDYHFVSALIGAGLNPRLLIVEYNARFPGKYVMPYKEDYHKSKAGMADFGASLASWADLLSDFRLLTANGVNAFFVHRDFEGLFRDEICAKH